MNPLKPFKKFPKSLEEICVEKNEGKHFVFRYKLVNIEQVFQVKRQGQGNKTCLVARLSGGYPTGISFNNIGEVIREANKEEIDDFEKTSKVCNKFN